jgi:serine phosphatase RsbU (regulator of sigma subunit)
MTVEALARLSLPIRPPATFNFICTVETIPTSSVWLGIVSTVSPVAEFLDDSEFSLEIGDILRLFTDGITEAVRKEKHISEHDRSV